MPSRSSYKASFANAPWLTEQGIDLARFPIDSVLRQALSPNVEEFRTGCALLNSMSHGGRVEAGVFLLGLLQQYSENYARFTFIAEALGSFPAETTVDALASELKYRQGLQFHARLPTTHNRHVCAISGSTRGREDSGAVV